MRIKGTLAKWNDDRGFGFITPTQGGAEVFAHVSAFPRGGQRPRLGERLTFEIGVGKDGNAAMRSMR
jgi:cold shock CspA family protein